MTIFGELGVLSLVAGAVSSYFAYRHMVSYYTFIEDLQKLRTEADRARALGVENELSSVEENSLQTEAALNLRQAEVNELAELLANDPEVSSDTTVSVMNVVRNANSYTNLYDFEVALLENILPESHYFWTAPAHKACMRYLTEDRRFNLQGPGYYASFAVKLNRLISENDDISQSIRLQTQLADAERSLTERQQQLETANQNVLRLEKQVETMAGNTGALERQYVELDRQAKRYLSQLEEEKKLHAETRKILDGVRAELTEVKDDRFQLQTKLRELEQALRKKDERIAELVSTIDTLRQESQEASRNIASLQRSLQERVDREFEFEARIGTLERHLARAIDGTNSDATLMSKQREREGLHRRQVRTNDTDGGVKLVSGKVS